MEQQINGHTYHFDKLPLDEQFHVARRLAPAVWAFGQSSLSVLQNALPEGVSLTLANLQKSLMGLEDGAMMGLLLSSADPLVKIISHMSNADSEYILYRCLLKVSRQVETGGVNVGWQPVYAENGGFIFQDMELPEMLQLVVASVRRNLGNFTLAPSTPA
jgi:predicted Zn-ribbon and HTH transcriptional regulator